MALLPAGGRRDGALRARLHALRPRPPQEALPHLRHYTRIASARAVELGVARQVPVRPRPVRGGPESYRRAIALSEAGAEETDAPELLARAGRFDARGGASGSGTCPDCSHMTEDNPGVMLSPHAWNGFTSASARRSTRSGPAGSSRCC